MGHRANLIIGSSAGYELYYTHWRASTLDSDLFWGPDAAMAFIRRQRSGADGADWLDEVWAEGGAVLDPVNRMVLWFGGQDMLYDVPLRRVHLALMRELWPGWELRWAHEGIVDMARHLRRTQADLLDEKEEPYVPRIEEPKEPDWISTVLSLRDRDGRLKLHALDGDSAQMALVGPALRDVLASADLPDAYDYAARTSTFPTGGVHIDEASQRVDVWLAGPSADFERRLRAAWRGWEARWHRDRFESVTALLGERLTLPVPRRDDLVSKSRAIALRESRDLSGLIHELQAHQPPKGLEAATPRANPFALRDDPAPTPGSELVDALDRAIERWRANQRGGS